jgi:hypothetical protein
VLSKGLSWKVNHRSQNVGIEESRGNIIVDQRKVLKIWENYITELYDRANRTENVEIYPEEKVDADEKCPCVFHREVEKSCEEINKKPTADDDVPGNGLTLSGKDCMKYDNTTDQQHV